ncbi:hypothetical protein BH11MYX3_BH11MYX3_47730 [soil metagenome]
MTVAAAELPVVGPYRILKAIGAGGSARIDLARGGRAYGFQLHVVIKRPLEHLRNDPSVAASLRREDELGGRLRHPNLVAVLDAGQHDGYDYLALEYVHGASLRTLMQATSHEDTDTGVVRRLPLVAALSIVIEVARGLHEAHELTGAHGNVLGLVHRDVSPNNILLGADGTVKLSDFGIAKDTRVSTLSGSMRGTVTYMAPEQCRGHAFDRRADVFSLGVILFELVTGRRLFWADNDVASLHKVLSGLIPDPRTLVPGLAPQLSAIMLAAIAPDQEARTRTTAELADRLEEYAARACIGTGARWIARTMEAELGVRSAPWIETDVAASATAPEPAEELSLVSVIEGTVDGPDDALPPTFGDTSDDVVEERVGVGAPPSVNARPGRQRRVVIAIAAATSIALAVGIGMALRSGPQPDAGADHAVVPAVPSAASAPAPPPAEVPAREPTPDLDVEPAGSAAVAAPGDPIDRRRRRRTPVRAPAIVDTAANVPVDAGVTPVDASRPVEWNPNLLLPTDDPKAPPKRRPSP